MTVRLIHIIVSVHAHLIAKYPVSSCKTKMINSFIHLMDKTVLVCIFLVKP